MDYKSLISNCESRSEEFRMMHNAEGVVHELQCAKAISDLLERAEAEENRVEMLEYANRILSEKITEAEAKCKRLDESRERANESAYMWESRCKMLEARAENAERERDAYKEMIYKERPCAFCVECTGNWNPECIRCDRCTTEYRPKFRLREQKGE